MATLVQPTKQLTVIGCSNTGQTAGGATKVGKIYAKNTGNPEPLDILLPNSLGGNSHEGWGTTPSYWQDVDNVHIVGTTIWYQVCIAKHQNADWTVIRQHVARMIQERAGDADVVISGLHGFEVDPGTLDVPFTWTEANALVEDLAALNVYSRLSTPLPDLLKSEVRTRGAGDHPNEAGSQKLGRWLINYFTGLDV